MLSSFRRSVKGERGRGIFVLSLNTSSSNCCCSCSRFIKQQPFSTNQRTSSSGFHSGGFPEHNNNKQIKVKTASGNVNGSHEGFVNKWSSSRIVSMRLPLLLQTKSTSNQIYFTSLLTSSQRLLSQSHSSTQLSEVHNYSPPASQKREPFKSQVSKVNKLSLNSRFRITFLNPKAPYEIHTRMSSTNAASNGSSSPYTITLENMNPNVIKMEYAVRGPLVIRAGQLEKELKEGVKKPFTEIIRANIGDCHAMGQVPITFIRQVLACVSDPGLIKDSNYPDDVKERARQLLEATGPGKSAGCYSDSAGVELIRRDCARFITERDGIEAKHEDIVLTTGASEAVRAVLALINSKTTANGNQTVPSGVMIPIPQYPLYTATLAEYGMQPIPYYLDEKNHWSLDIKELERSLNESRDKCTPKAIVIINPGNPTGSVLTRQNIEDVIKFARKENLMVMADEVYQHNIYKEGDKFHSFKKVMTELGIKLELASMMSASKGYMGECGLRGGYAEIINLQPEVKVMFLKMLSARLCSSVLGQMALDCIVNPPKKGDPSYDLHQAEKTAVLESLKQRARLVADTFNSVPGMRSNEVAGAMYAFPEIILPEKAIKAAKEKGQAADVFYAWELLENVGICIVPGSGFGQIPGTYHFRTTILPQPQNLGRMMEKLKKFHVEFCEKYK